MPKVKRFEVPVYVGLTPKHLDYVKWRARFCSSLSEWLRAFIDTEMNKDDQWTEKLEKEDKRQSHD